MMPVLRQELGWSVRGSLGWTKEASGWNWRMPDRLWRGRIAAMLICGLRRKHLSAKTKKKRGRRGLSPWPLRCLNQTLSERKERVCRLIGISTQFLLTFHCWGSYIFIMYIVPNLRAARILSYWIRYFLPLSNEVLKESGYQATFLFDESRFIG